MDILKELIDGLEETERKEFKVFLNRFRKKSSRIDLKLFNLYCKTSNFKRTEAISKLYTEHDRIEAYHGTRKRLIKHLVEFIPHHVKSVSAESERSVENLLMVAEFLFEKHREDAAWTFLKQAEETARKSESYNLLNTIYSIQIERYQSDLAPELEELIHKKEKYQALAIEDDNANIAYQMIRHELEKSKQEGKEIDLDSISNRILSKYDLKEGVLERPKLIYNLIAIIRSSILLRKEFHKFEPYIEKKFKEINKKGYFNEFNHYYKVNMLYMLAHVKYRNKKFSESEEYLNQLYSNSLLYNKSHYYKIYSKYILLLAAVKTYSGKCKKAIVDLENLVNNKKITLDHSAYLNAYLNLVTYYFYMEEYQKAARCFLKISHSDARLAKIMGREWVLKKMIAEILVQYELGNSDLVDKKIKSINRNFKDLFQRSVYKRVGIYVALLKKLNDNPGIATTQQFRQMVDESFEYVRKEEEDIQATTAFCWIKSKVVNKKYYDVLVHSVNFVKERKKIALERT
jgi:hypothetical protein